MPTIPSVRSTKMKVINVDIIIELVQYLGILEQLSLAHSCGVAFRASREYSFWSPHRHPPSGGLATFLPEERVGPWKSYSGDEIRGAAAKMRALRSRWGSEHVRARSCNYIGSYFQLQAVPGSRWLYSIPKDFNFETIGFADGKTGTVSLENLDISSSGINYTGQYWPKAVLLEPNRIMVACLGGKLPYDVMMLSWPNSSGPRVLAFYEVTFSINEKNGTRLLETSSLPIRVYGTSPDYSQIQLNCEFAVLESNLLGSWRLGIYYISSGRHWTYHEANARGGESVTLLEQWCFLVRDIGGAPYLVAIHLLSLLSLPEEGSDKLDLPKGRILTSSLDLQRLSISPTSSFDVKIFPSLGRELPDDNVNYTVMLSSAEDHFTFDIKVQPVPDSPYGSIFRSSGGRSLPTESQMRGELPIFLSARSGSSNIEPYAPESIRTSQIGPETLFSVYNIVNYVKILYMVDLDKRGRSRTLDWSVPPRPHAGPIDEERRSLVTPMLFSEVAYWDTATGLLLFWSNGWRAPRVHHTCWF